MKKIFLIFIAAVFILPLFNSCSSHSKSVSLTAILEQVDIYISLNNSSEAYSLLKQAEKSASTYFERLGVYKRYIILGDKKKAVSVLSEALKEFPDNNQIRAVYVQFLLDEGKTKDAVKAAKKLDGTEYSSLYAESSLKMLLEEKDPDAFKDSSLINVYIEAWKGSGDSVWLRNGALLYLRDGKFLEAAELYPENVSGKTDVLFWQKVLYDAGDYVKSAAAGECEAVFDDYPSLEEHLMLLSDCYHVLNYEENESLCRRELIDRAEALNVLPDEFNENLAKCYMNDALYCASKGDAAGEFAGINYLLSVNSCYVPALALYAQEAFDSKPYTEDRLMQELRDSGLKTLKMEENDLKPRASVDIAIYRIENALSQSDSAALKVLHHSVLNKKNTSDGKEQRSSKVWEFLEQNELGKNLYPPEIVDYAVGMLIHENSADTAQLIFDRNIEAVYGKDFIIADNIEKMRRNELVYAAWFACRDGNADTAEKIYDFLNSRYGKQVTSLVNLSVIYAGTFREEKAVEALSEASSIASDSFTKSEILYRMGRLSDSLGDTKNAVRSLQYALQLNPGNNKARLLLKNVLN